MLNPLDRDSLEPLDPLDPLEPLRGCRLCPFAVLSQAVRDSPRAGITRCVAHPHLPRLRSLAVCAQVLPGRTWAQTRFALDPKQSEGDEHMEPDEEALRSTGREENRGEEINKEPGKRKREREREQ